MASSEKSMNIEATMTIDVDILGTKIKLTKEQARLLRDRLDSMLGSGFNYSPIYIEPRRNNHPWTTPYWFGPSPVLCDGSTGTAASGARVLTQEIS